jgi:hypothetical protein
MPNFLTNLKERANQVAINLMSSEEEKTVRLNTCLECEHLIKITRQCSKCFCIIDAKVIPKKSKCPIGKW